MPEYKVSFDYTEYVEQLTGEDPDTGYDVYEDVAEDFSDVYWITADTEDEAREQAEDELTLDYNDVYIWAVEESDA